MMRIESAPFLRIGSGKVVPGPWMNLRTGLVIPADGLDGWDPSVDLELERQVSIDLDGARAGAGLTDADRLTCAATWHCPVTTLRGAGSRVDVVDSKTTLRVRLTIPGSELAGRVSLRTLVTLGQGGGGNRPLAAIIPGSVLWEETTVLALEGRGSRFPMEWLEFGRNGWLPGGAGWYLEWSPDEPEAPALGAVRLYLNEGHEVVRAAVTANPPEPHQQAIRRAIEFDVARSLILGALRADPAAWDKAAGEPGSIASVVNRLLRVVFPQESLEGLRNRYRTTPQRVEVKIQDGMRLFRDLTSP